MAIVWEELVDKALNNGFVNAIKANKAIQLAGKTMLDEDVSVLRSLKAGLGDSDIAATFKDVHGMSMDDAFKKYVSKDIEKFTTDEKIAAIDALGSTYFNGNQNFKKSFDVIRQSNFLRGNGEKIGAGGFAKSTLNYYSLADLENRGFNKATIGTAAARYGTSVGAVGLGAYGVHKALD